MHFPQQIDFMTLCIYWDSNIIIQLNYNNWSSEAISQNISEIGFDDESIEKAFGILNSNNKCSLQAKLHVRWQREKAIIRQFLNFKSCSSHWAFESFYSTRNSASQNSHEHLNQGNGGKCISKLASIKFSFHEHLFAIVYFVVTWCVKRNWDLKNKLWWCTYFLQQLVKFQCMLRKHDQQFCSSQLPMIFYQLLIQALFLWNLNFYMVLHEW